MPDSRQRRERIAVNLDLIPKVLQNLLSHLREWFLIVEIKNALTRSTRHGCRLRDDIRNLVPKISGKIQVESGAFAGPAVNENRTVVILHDAMNHRQSQTGTLTRRLRREERFEDPA